MTKKQLSQLHKNAAKAMRGAVEKVVEEHRRTGIPLAVWKNGKVASIQAKNLKLSK